jgi:tyrosine ammonia-lyase
VSLAVPAADQHPAAAPAAAPATRRRPPAAPATVDAGALDLGGHVTPAAVHAVALGGRAAVVGPGARARMAASAAFLARCVEERRLVYGVTTGYGPLARHHVAPEHAPELQRNLVRHLAAGVGAPLSVPHTRALMAARLASLARGRSGVGAPVVDLLLACLARGVTPVVPERGTVGASGDLTPLAHVALVLIGEGRAAYAGGVHAGADALRAAGLAPVGLGHKEGLALVNGTSAMTGIAAVNAERARRLVECAARLAVLHAEVLGAHVEAWDARFGLARPHPGQRAAHARLLALAAGSARLTASVQPPPRLDARADATGLFTAPEPPQDPYTLRCVPQELGAALDVLAFHAGVVETELNAATDNPLVFADGADDPAGAVLHGGNFYGQHVAFASDALAMAVVKLAAWSERALARLVNPAHSRGLPAFLHAGPPGLSSGLMGAQVTATALVAEMRAGAVPASIQTIPTNNDNQDVVTMGTIAARKAAWQLDLAWQVLAIHAVALAQAAERRAGDAGPRDARALAAAGFAPAGCALWAAVRATVAPLDADRALSDDIERLAEVLERDDALLGASPFLA